MRYKALAFALLPLALSGAAMATDATLIEAARKEGQVVWYTSLVQNQVARPMAAAFEKKYPGISVQVVAGTVGDLELKIRAEMAAKSLRADVHHGGGATASLIKAGFVEPYRPESAAAYPAAYKDPNGFWTAQVLNFHGPAINTDLVKPQDEPKTYQDLLDPKWKGKIAWTTQMSQGGPPGFIGTILLSMGQEAGMDYLRKLVPQIVNVPANQRVVLDQVISGEYPIALATFIHHSEISIKQGAPVKWLRFNPLTATMDPIFLLKDAPHPNAAKLFINFVLSSEGQAVFREAGYIPADPALPAQVPELKPEIGKFTIQPLSPAVIADNLASWIAIYDKLYK